MDNTFGFRGLWLAGVVLGCGDPFPCLGCDVAERTFFEGEVTTDEAFGFAVAEVGALLVARNVCSCGRTFVTCFVSADHCKIFCVLTTYSGFSPSAADMVASLFASSDGGRLACALFGGIAGIAAVDFHSDCENKICDDSMIIGRAIGIQCLTLGPREPCLQALSQ